MYLIINSVRSVLPNFKSINEKTSVVLSPKADTNVFKNILENNGYVQTESEARFVADTLIERSKHLTYSRLFDLQKRMYGEVSTKVLDSINKLNSDTLFASALRESKKRLGQEDSVFKALNSIMGQPDRFEFSFDKVKVGDTSGIIQVKVIQLETEWQMLGYKKTKKVPVKDVYVRLQKHFREDSLGLPVTIPIAYIKTNAEGIAVFNGLDTAASYSVLPIKEGFEYGSSKGSRNGTWGEKKYLGLFGKPNTKLDFTFEQKEHRIAFVSNSVLRQIKSNKTLLMRSPEEWKMMVIKWVAIVLVAWILLCLAIASRKRYFDGLLVASGLFLTTFSVLVMFSIQHPLVDELYGVDMAKGVVLGVAAAILLQFFDFEKFY